MPIYVLLAPHWALFMHLAMPLRFVDLFINALPLLILHDVD